MIMKIEMRYNHDESRWEVILDGEMYSVIVPESWETTALALACCAHAGFDIESCFTCCEYDYDNRTIIYEEEEEE